MTDHAERAAAILWHNWQAGSCISSLPDDCFPGDLDAGYRVQQAMVDICGQKPVGYKIAASSKAGQSHLKISHPVYGRLLSHQILSSGENATWRDHPMSVAELEFAFLIGREIPPRTDPYDWQEVVEAVEAMHIGIELPGSRFFDAARAGIAQIIADNASAYLYILGPQAPPGWQEYDLAECKAEMLIDGKSVTQGLGSDALGDPRFSLAWLVNQLSRKGIGLGKGQIVTTGVCGQPVPVSKGQHIVGDFGLFGEVDVNLV